LAFVSPNENVVKIQNCLTVVQSLEEDNNHFNGDGTVNTLDLRIAAIYFGQEGILHTT